MGSTAKASSPCCGNKKLEAPMEIANPIMAADVLALRLPSVGRVAPTGGFSPESFNKASKEWAELAAHEGTCLTFCVNVRFKNDLLVCDEHLTVPKWFSQSMRDLTLKCDLDHGQ
jgi:hypothetical protein